MNRAKFTARSVIAIRTIRWNYDFLRKEWRFYKKEQERNRSLKNEMSKMRKKNGEL